MRIRYKNEGRNVLESQISKFRIAVENFSEITKKGHIWQESHNNTENRIDKTRKAKVDRKTRKQKASYRGNTTQKDAYPKKPTRNEGPVGHPEQISTLPCREIKEIKVLSLRESGIAGPVPKDSLHYSIHFLVAVMP